MIKTLKDIQQSQLSLDLIASQVVEGFITGLHKSPFHGFSVEFAEHRQYNSGESIRHIDWKLFGKTDKFFVKRYEEETNLRAHILIDISSSMNFPWEPKVFSKLDFSIFSAAAIIQLLVKQRDAVGVSLFSDNVDISTEVKSNSLHARYLFSILEEKLNAYEKSKSSSLLLKKNTHIAEVLHEMAEKIHKRSLIIIFSDMFSSTQDVDPIFNSLQHLKYKNNEVILFHVQDSSLELDFKFANKEYRFFDLETDKEIKLNPLEIKDIYQKELRKYYRNLKSKCEQYQIDFVDADISQGFYQVLQNYLVKRQKMY